MRPYLDLFGRDVSPCPAEALAKTDGWASRPYLTNLGRDTSPTCPHEQTDAWAMRPYQNKKPALALSRAG